VSTLDWTAVISAAFAAIAALGSAGAAFIMLRQWTAQTTPALSVDVAEVFPKRTLYLTIVNFGGPIKKVSFAAVEGCQACLSFLPPHGFLRPGESARLQLHMDSVDEATIAVVYGFDLSGRYVYAWAANGQAGRWRARSGRWWWNQRPTDLSAVEILQRFYPTAPDPTSLESRASVLVPRTDDWP